MNQDDFFAAEDADGVRFNFNTFPVTTLEANRLVFPLGAVLCPLQDRSDLPRMMKYPMRCFKCQNFFSNHCQLDNIGWSCCFCGAKNQISQEILHEEMNSSSIEYIVNPMRNEFLSVVFVIDLSLEPEELKSLIESIAGSLELLPMNCQVGLVTFDACVKIYEFNEIINKSFVIQGEKLYQDEVLQKFLGGDKRKFLTQDFTKFKSILLNLKSVTTDSKDERSRNCFGQAIKTLSNCFNNGDVHVLLFIGTPVTIGEGNIVSLDKKVQIRTFNDDFSSNKKSTNFYTNIANRKEAANSSMSFSIFASSYNQVGVYEMSDLTLKTGGYLILNDSFTSNLFKQNYLKVFELNKIGELDLVSNSHLSIRTSNYLEVQGIVGDVIKEEIKNNRSDVISGVADTEIGVGFTNNFKIPLSSSKHNYSIYFKVKTVGHTNERRKLPNWFYIQFQTFYNHPDGSKRMRLTTLKKPTTNEPSFKNIETSFDQEASIVLFAKEIVYKFKTINFKNISNKIDNFVIEVMRNFGIYIKGEINSFHFAPNFSLLIQFFYNLKKSPILTNFNKTPDEFIYYIDTFLKANVSDSLLMIQPTLTCFTAEEDQPPTPVLLDSSSLRKDCVLLMDSFFHIVIQFGEAAAHWRDSELDREEFANVYRMIEEPIEEVREILHERFPLPRYINTDEGQSQSRFLISRLNPSNDDLYTEEVSLNKYYRTLLEKVIHL